MSESAGTVKYVIRLPRDIAAKLELLRIDRGNSISRSELIAELLREALRKQHSG